MSGSEIETAEKAVAQDAETTPAHEKLRRRAHDRFISTRTQEALSDAIYAVQTVTVFDHARIVEQLAARLNEYLNVSHLKEFRNKAVSFVTRQAELAAKIHVLMPELVEVARGVRGCQDSGHIAAMIYRRTPEYTGSIEDADALREWATATTVGEAEGVAALAAWIEEHRKIVFDGIWSIFRDCLDLGIHDGVIDELAADVWRWASHNTVSLLESNVPIHLRLRGKASSVARTWKTIYLRERENKGGEFVKLEKLARFENRTGTVATEVIDLEAIHNPIIIRELPWTHADLDRELRRAGLFRVDDAIEHLCVAA